MNAKPATITALALFALCGTGDLVAQSRGQDRVTSTTPTQPPAQTAITTDGRTVVLRSDGTWVYAKSDPKVEGLNPSAPSVSRQNSTLSLDAGLIYRSGDVKPAARTTFYLLDTNPGNVLKEAGLKPSIAPAESLDRPNVLVLYLGTALTSGSDSYQAFLSASMAALKPHIVQSIVTDFNGKAQFPAVLAGAYYLMGATRTGGGGMALWNLKLELTPGPNSITLDNNNTTWMETP